MIANYVSTNLTSNLLIFPFPNHPMDWCIVLMKNGCALLYSRSHPNIFFHLRYYEDLHSLRKIIFIITNRWGTVRWSAHSYWLCTLFPSISQSAIMKADRRTIAKNPLKAKFHIHFEAASLHTHRLHLSEFPHNAHHILHILQILPS